MNQSQQMKDDLREVINPMKDVLGNMGLDRDGFLSTKVDEFMKLSEERPQEPALRKLGKVVAVSEGHDEEVNGHARAILTAFTEKAEPGMLEACPICATKALKTFECGECGFSFIEDFRCPYLSEGGERQCRKANNRPCDLFGLEFEDCGVFT